MKLSFCLKKYILYGEFGSTNHMNKFSNLNNEVKVANTW